VRINELFIGWQEKRVAVEELVRAAQLQRETVDYPGSWELLDQALSLEPASLATRQEQIRLALVWVRNISIHDTEDFTDAIDRLMPVLYRGAASEDPRNAAIISAHLGWADYLRVRKGNKKLDVERHFKRSLRLDPENMYGNVMYGYWLLRSGNPLQYSTERVEQAAKHFQKALDSGESRDYVRHMQMSAYLFSGNLDAKIKAYETAISILNKGETISQYDRVDLKNDLIQIVTGKDGGERNHVRRYDKLVEIFGPDDLLKVFRWAYPSEEEPDETGWLYVQGRLLEEAGDEQAAIELYRQLISRWPGTVNVHSNTARERIRQIELKQNICYVPMLVVTGFSGGTQSAVTALQREDILLSYNGEYIHNLDELDKAKELVDAEKDVSVVFVRDATPLLLNVKPGKLGIILDKREVSERALGEYAEVLCGRENVP
jgi:tetratricopeptide (TPR) repeat protein